MADTGMLAIKWFLTQDSVMRKLEEVMGKNPSAFVSTVLQVISQNTKLAQADPQSVYLAALVSATLDLPINPNLWFAYIVPYWDRNAKKQNAQFQMWYKWFIQLAQRSGQFKRIGATKVLEWQLVEENPLEGHIFDWTKKDSETVIWYASHMKLLNGFEKVFYMSAEEMEAHAKKYSQTYKNWFGNWKDNFEAMAEKTVIKLLLSKYAPLSIDMQTAIQTDQAVIQDENLTAMEYTDNPEILEQENTVDPELLASWEKDLEECKTLEEVQELKKQNNPTDPTILSLFEKYETNFQS